MEILLYSRLLVVLKQQYWIVRPGQHGGTYEYRQFVYKNVNFMSVREIEILLYACLLVALKQKILNAQHDGTYEYAWFVNKM